MGSLLLAIIYLAFISLGLPDSLLGAAWPVMQGELGVPLSYAGVVTMIITGGTIISSLMTDRLIRRMGTGLLTALSVGLTALALMGFSLAGSFGVLCALAVPYGLGAGAIDAALNNYVALHYSSRHMSWLHACWGVGVTISPAIMARCLAGSHGWTAGYRSVALIQLALTALMLFSLPVWKRHRQAKSTGEGEVVPRVLSLPQALRIRGVPCILLAFFSFCALEATGGLWASSYLVEYRGIDVETAARFAALFYSGITAGRFLNGFIADRLGDRTMIRIGVSVMLLGCVLTALPLKADLPALIGLVVIGFGSAPVYPCIIHSTPVNFGRENSQSLVGIQMACAYVGSTFMAPLFGLIAQHLGIGLYPLYLTAFVLILLIMTEWLNRLVPLKK